MELLIKAIDITSTDPVKDRCLAKRGDIIVAFEDGHVWGNLEKLPPEQGGKFVILKFPGVELSQLAELAATEWGVKDITEPEWEDVTVQSRDGEFRTIRQMARRCRCHIKLDDLTTDNKRSLDKDGELTVSWNAIRDKVRDKVTTLTANNKDLPPVRKKSPIEGGR